MPYVFFEEWRELQPVGQTRWGLEPHTLSLILFYYTVAIRYNSYVEAFSVKNPSRHMILKKHGIAQYKDLLKFDLD